MGFFREAGNLCDTWIDFMPLHPCFQIERRDDIASSNTVRNARGNVSQSEPPLGGATLPLFARLRNNQSHVPHTKTHSPWWGWFNIPPADLCRTILHRNGWSQRVEGVKTSEKRLVKNNYLWCHCSNNLWGWCQWNIEQHNHFECDLRRAGGGSGRATGARLECSGNVGWMQSAPSITVCSHLICQNTRAAPRLQTCLLPVRLF